MAAGSSRSYLTIAAAIVIAAALISASIFFAFGQAAKTVTSTTVSTVTSTEGLEPTTSYSTISDSGLQLQVTLNSTSIPLRGEVTVQIDLRNTQSQNVSLTVVPNKNISGWNTNDFFCASNPSHSLVGFAVFKGSFAAGNISSAGSPLQLAASSVAIPCPYSLPLNDTTFLPNSDRTMSFSYYGQTEEPPYALTAEVNATTGYCVYSGLSGECRGTSGILGYWNESLVGNSSLGSNDFTYLPAGGYTIVAMDDWGQTLYAHFAVAASSAGETTGAGSVFAITFRQAGACNPAVYVAPWSVTLGNVTEAEPPGTPLPIPNGGYSAGPEPSSVYTIIFSVPNGTYQYSVRPQGAFYSYTGTVTVNSSDVSITLNGPVVSCTTTTSS